MKSKTLYTILGLVIGVTFILIIGAKPAKVCWLNKGGQYHTGSAQEPRDDQQIVDMKYCLGESKQSTPTDGPRLPTERPPATQVANTPTPRATVIIPPDNPTATATKRFDPTATATRRINATPTVTGEYTDPKGDPKLPDPTATPCPNCQPCPDIRCSLATIAAAQATQAEFVSGMP